MSTSELKEAVKEMLITDGRYSNLKAELERIVIEKLVGDDKSVVKRAKQQDLQLADALVAEYLTWRGCHQSCGVFRTEGELGPERLKRDLLRDLNVDQVDPSTNEVPILLAIVREFKASSE